MSLYKKERLAMLNMLKQNFMRIASPFDSITLKPLYAYRKPQIINYALVKEKKLESKRGQR